jgi:hypothetical protein
MKADFCMNIQSRFELSCLAVAFSFVLSYRAVTSFSDNYAHGMGFANQIITMNFHAMDLSDALRYANHKTRRCIRQILRVRMRLFINKCVLPFLMGRINRKRESALDDSCQ